MGTLVKAGINLLTRSATAGCKSRRTFILSGFASLLLTIILSGTGQLRAQETAVVLLELQSMAPGKGQTSSVVVRIEDAVNVYGVQIDLAFDASQIRVLDADENKPGVQILAGDFLTVDEGFEAANEVNNESGRLIYAYSRLAPAEPVSGSGTLLQFEVEALEPGSIDLLLGPVIIASPEGDELPVRVADTTEENGVPFVPAFTATVPGRATDFLLRENDGSAADAPASSTPTTEITRQPTTTAQATLVDTATVISLAAENSVPHSEAQATVETPLSSDELATSTLPAPPATNEPEPVATNTGTTEAAGTDAPAVEIAAVAPAAEQENALPAAEQATPTLIVIGQNVNPEKNRVQAAAPEAIANNEGTIESMYLAIGLTAISVALIAIWFLWRFRLR